jgi:hypothetical protein
MYTTYSFSDEFDFLEPPPPERKALKYGKKFALAV